jgi:LacI family transcriptional regulator
MVSLKDVARSAGVSVMTVSRVINRSGYASQSAREKVLEAIRETGYRVNQTAVGLRTGKTNSIGIIISDISNPFFPFIIKGIDYVCSQNYFDTILFNTGEDRDRELRYIDLLKQKYVRGIIISSCIPDYKKYKEIFDGLTPVFLNRKPKGIQADFVLNDDYKAAFIATEHLIKKGNRKIAFINGNTQMSTFRQRHLGLLDAMKHYEIPVFEELVVTGEYSIEGGYRSTAKIFNGSIYPEAILPANDFITIGMYKFLKEHRIEILNKVSVVGYNDLNWCSLVDPPLTVVKVKKFEMGKKAAELLFDRLKGRSPNSYQEIILEPEFIIRGSVKNRITSKN